jgi:hypothetical protein
MVAAAHFAPYYPAITKSTLIKTIEPAKVFAGIPPDQYQQQAPGFAATFNAVNTMVYAYAGAILFVAFLSEMRHPLDFWKGMFMAQAFICIVYMFFGVFCYSFYGQYSANNIVNVVNPYGLQTAGNILRLLSGWIAIIMYDASPYTCLHDCLKSLLIPPVRFQVLQHRDEDRTYSLLQESPET